MAAWGAAWYGSFSKDYFLCEILANFEPFLQAVSALFTLDVFRTGCSVSRNTETNCWGRESFKHFICVFHLDEVKVNIYK